MSPKTNEIAGTSPALKAREVHLGAIIAHAAYPLSVFMRLTGLNQGAMRRARRTGLRTITVGRLKFVRGSDFLTYLEKQVERECT